MSEGLDWANALTMWDVTIESHDFTKQEIVFQLTPHEPLAKEHFPSFRLRASFQLDSSRGIFQPNCFPLFTNTKAGDIRKAYTNQIKFNLLNFVSLPLLSLLDSDRKYELLPALDLPLPRMVLAYPREKNPHVKHENQGSYNILTFLYSTKGMTRWSFATEPGEEEKQKNRAFLDFFMEEVDTYVCNFALAAAMETDHSWKEITKLIRDQTESSERSISLIFTYVRNRLKALADKENKPLANIVKSFVIGRSQQQGNKREEEIIISKGVEQLTLTESG
jgi:hypothetical protein